MKKWMSLLLIAVCAVALTACSSKRKSQDDMAMNDGDMAYSDGDAQTVGMNEDGSNYGDGQGANPNALAQRTYHFDFDSSAIRSEDRPGIEANARHLANNRSKRAIVEGHTDPRGSREYNIGLGERRAKSVANAMAENGANRSQIRVVSYGAQKLASNGRTEDDYQKDRRGVLVYTQQ